MRIREFDNGARKQEMTDRSKYQRAVRGDIAYNMMRMWQGTVGVAPADGLVSQAYVVARPFPEAEAAYYAFLFRTHAYMREIDVFSRGIVPDRNRLYWESFKQMPSVYLPPDEQRLTASPSKLSARMDGCRRHDDRHPKKGRRGQHSIRINDQWRICFTWTKEGPEHVEIVDYH